MSNLGLPVPPGFTITTEVCTHYYAERQKQPDDLKPAVEKALAHVGEIAGARFGDPAKPLLVSVRSGARASMPGMMDTVLNLGLNPQTVAGVAKQTGDERFAYDSYRRFIQMYSGVVLGSSIPISRKSSKTKRPTRASSWTPISMPPILKRIADLYKARVQAKLKKPFPEDVNEQLWGAIGAVFGSWMGARAKTYRRLHNIPEDWGTAVNVQAMVFGNRGATSATGVAFTRDPSTGERALYGEFLINAQGEDVVAGIRTPQSITKRAREAIGRSKRPSMEEAMPAAFAELSAIAAKLESHYRDMQDVEFTVQEGKLFMLQTRSGKRTARGVEGRRRNGGRGADHQGRSGDARRSRLARSIAASDARSQGREGRDRVGPGRVAGRGDGRGRVHRRRGGTRGGRRPRRDSGAPRNQPGRHSRHARGAGHPHRARRHDQPRRGGGARHGAAVRDGRRRAEGRCRARHHDRGRRHHRARRGRHHRRRRRARSIAGACRWCIPN